MTAHHEQASGSDVATSAASLLEHYRTIRRVTEELVAPLTAEDCAVQSMPESSPTRWHLAHTSWFWETFVLKGQGVAPFHSGYEYLFNSYYNTIGAQFPRAQRGLVSRPGLSEVIRYRAHVDREMRTVLEQKGDAELGDLAGIIQLGCAHEQQHQELLLTDIKHALSCNPLYPQYREPGDCQSASLPSLEWLGFDGGVHDIGHDAPGFAFDNEGPRHQVLLQDFEIASRLITNGEFLAFIEGGGYGDPGPWLSEGWDTVRDQGWSAPLYWIGGSPGFQVFTLAGLRELDPAEPVCHVSYFEADAFARWAGYRLATEFEWERAAHGCPQSGNMLDQGHYHPVTPEASDGRVPSQMLGDTWEWTGSPYAPYPGYRSLGGAVGEYNGKFMCNQIVLRGGSCVTPGSHIRNTYRNFFPPHARWQFSGIRLARDGS